VSGILGDFRLLREVGRGGMGIVYEAMQISLGRRVALKVLPFAATMDPRHLQRFQNEARAAASLHHTNIVPVYYVGCERGVHFYAMQFIDGQSLAAFLEQQHGSSANSNQPTTAYAPASPDAPAAETAVQAAASTARQPRDRAYFRRVAEWGIQAAEALDHAHQLGIVHRDVKPANLLVDPTGRLWITDFGLAQMQSDSRLTVTGDLVGTLRYMSPEQALAKRVPIDQRTDVYALGATLYELLTLHPVFGGNDRQELLRQIAFEEPRPPRRLDRAVPAELEVIALKALEKNPAERYGTAQELADDLRRFLHDEPIRARRSSLARRARKWARRHRAAVRAGTVLLVALMLLGGAALWLKQRQQAAAERAVEAALERSDLLQDQERFEEALGVLDAAEGPLEVRGLGALRQRVARSRRDLEMLLRLDKAHLQRAVGGDELGFDDAGADRLYSKAFERYGLDATALDPEAAAERVRTSAIGTHLIQGLDDWAFTRERLKKGSGESLRRVADLADEDPWRRRLREAAGRGNKAALEKLAEEKEPCSQPPANLVLLARALQATGSYAAAERLLRRAQPEYPADFWINFNLAYALLMKKTPDTADAVSFCRAALALRPQSAAVYNNLGAALKEQRKLAEAAAAFQKAIELQPDLALAHSNLGSTLREQGKLPEAVAACRKAITLRPKYATAQNNLGAALAAQGKLGEAVAAFQRAVQIEPAYATAYCNLGNAWRQLGNLGEAAAFYREWTKLEPTSAAAYGALVQALLELGRFAEARTEIRRFLERLTERDPMRQVASQQLQRCERLLALDEKLPAVLKGQAEPIDVAERIALAQFCRQYKRRYAAAARFYADAFATQPALVNDLNHEHRYNAACYAALAGCGQGEDAAQLDDKERTRWRNQALDWLRADLARYGQAVDKGPAQNLATAAHRLQRWQQDTDFAGVRGVALTGMPKVERAAWHKLWADVANTLGRAREKATPERKPDPK
jgi:serine/threonine protein kinase/Tfp pilus assembly protein PilF